MSKSIYKRLAAQHTKGFKIQVAVQENYNLVWRGIHPVGGMPYVYPTEDEAQRMRRLCYGDPKHYDRSRVVPVETCEGAGFEQSCSDCGHTTMDYRKPDEPMCLSCQETLYT